ncbi:TonB-dependent receptor [Parasphingopyxis algicola]|uniref:TonB-dependent receptor n=1 Tax=Parasphingopyxis algicola TaxID=2026624 RepID=UPI0015A4A95B|nr:TonB-dependent receptor [Parasphingopyxis algicola]QLC24859.1 TonB-dependent receptor [Parasphingopyxis algicola]
MRNIHGTCRAGLFASTAAVFLATLSTPAFGQEADAQPESQALADEEAVDYQQASEDARQSSADMLTDVILVTGRRIGQGEALQDAPVAVTAFGEAQLEAAYVRDLQGLSYAIPNVALDQGAAFPGIQNFSIRGLGTVGTVPSIDPTVGVLVDGVYLGTTYGVLTDVYDLEVIEVLRGPQGVAFGRNVTGGAILVNTTTPTDEFEAKFRATLETGPEWGVAGAINVPISDGVSARLTSYYTDDNGFFESSVSDDFGESETLVIRPALRISPSGPGEIILRYEYGKITGDGPVWQFADTFSGFQTGSDEEGSNRIRWDQFIAEINLDVGFWDGTITNIFGWRDVGQQTRLDLDGSPNFLFHANIDYAQDQISNELRFSGTPMDGVKFTVGAYYFEQDLFYIERREILDRLIVGSLGGRQDSWTAAAFTAIDIDLSDTITLNLGLRYTEEEKSVQIATFNTTNPPCDLGTGICNFDFSDSENWSSWMPRVGLQWQPNNDLQVYGNWSRGFRSGGYNFRSFSTVVPPGPYDEETNDAFELGFKSDLFDRRLRVNTAVFWNELSDLQRDINFPTQNSGNAQVIRNSADARIRGVEVEFTARPVQDLVLTGTIGYVDAEYTDVFFDINGDGAIDQVDENLELVRAAPWSLGFGANYEIFLENIGSVVLRAEYSHRDRTAVADRNNAFLPASDIVDASIVLRPEDVDMSVSFFVRNLTNEVTLNGATLTGLGLFQQPNEGRTFGVETNVRF